MTNIRITPTHINISPNRQVSLDYPLSDIDRVMTLSTLLGHSHYEPRWTNSIRIESSVDLYWKSNWLSAIAYLDRLSIRGSTRRINIVGLDKIRHTRYITINHTSIERIPDHLIIDTYNVNLDDNYISDMPRVTGNMADLSLRNNRIKHMNWINHYSTVDNIDLSHNLIETVSDISVIDVAYISTLNLSNNGIYDLSGFKGKPLTINNLILSYNLITAASLTDVFNPTIPMYISLYENPIYSVDNMFVNSDPLDILLYIQDADIDEDNLGGNVTLLDERTWRYRHDDLYTMDSWD